MVMREIIDYLRRLKARCDSCKELSCAGCLLAPVRGLLTSYQIHTGENALGLPKLYRCSSLEVILPQLSDKPILFRDIRYRGCRQRKYRALVVGMKHGLINRKFANGHWQYFLTKEKQ